MLADFEAPDNQVLRSGAGAPHSTGEEKKKRSCDFDSHFEEKKIPQLVLARAVGSTVGRLNHRDAK
jgi:hypothetical protein